MRASVFVLVAILPLIMNPWAGDAYGYPKAQALYISCAASGLLWLGSRSLRNRPWRLTPPEWALWAYLLTVLLSTWQSTDLLQSVIGTSARYEGLVTVTAYVFLFFVGVHFLASAKWLFRLATIVTFAGVIAAAYGLVQLFVPPAFFAENIMTASYGSLGLIRPVSTFGSPTILAGFLALIGPLGVTLSLRATGIGRHVWLSSSVLIYAALVITLTRAAWVAATIGGIVFVIALRGGLRRQGLVLCAVVIVAVAASYALMAMARSKPSAPHLGERVLSTLDVYAGSVGQRVFIWKQTLSLIRTRPLLGWGLETLGSIFPYDRPSLVVVFGRRPVIIDRAHNDLLQTAVSVGVPGALAYVAFWALCVRSAVRLAWSTKGTDRLIAAGWLAGLVAYLIQAQLSFSAVAVTPLVWLFAGAAAGWELAARNTGNFESSGE